MSDAKTLANNVEADDNIIVRYIYIIASMNCTHMYLEVSPLIAILCSDDVCCRR